MSKKTEHFSRSEKETSEIAGKILEAVINNKKKRANVVGLSGDLGAGKTTLVKAVSKKLGIKERINSPTFVIMKRYPIKAGQYKNFFHLDAYRLKSPAELYNLGWKEVIHDPANLVFIEWPENVQGALPEDITLVQVLHKGEKERSFRVV